MSKLPRISGLFSSKPTDLPAEEDEKVEVNDIPQYDASFDPRTAETLMDKETKIFDPNTGDIFAGKWPRVMFREAANQPLQPTWMGYKRNAQEGARPVPIPHDAWFRHAAIFGATGYGKTTLLKNIMIQWAYSGHGFCFIDPNGDGVMDIMKLLPEERLDDVIYIEPETEYEKVVGFNFLEISNATTQTEREAEKEGVIDDLIGIIKDESYWGPRMDGVFSNIARGMISSEKKYTLIDMYWVLLDEEYREKFVEDVDDPGVRKYTKVIAEEMDQSDLEPIVRRLQKFVENQTIREIIAHDESSFDIKDAVEGNKIILVNNNTNSSDAQQMIATGVMRRIWSAVKAREAIPKSERKPFFLIVDEFDNIATEEANIGAMISEARKFRLSLTLCNQQPHQLPKSIQEDLLSTDNLISFNPKNPSDARYIMQRFGEYDKDDILGLDYFKAFCTIPLGQGSSDPFTFNTFPDYPPRRGQKEVERVITQSLEKYGGPKPDPIEAVNTRTLDQQDVHNAGNDGEVIRAESEDGDETFEITERSVLESILTLELRQLANGNDNGKQVPTDDIVPELERRLNTEVYQSIPAQIIEKMSSGDMIEIERKQNQLFVTLTEEGRDFLMSIDTGGGATGGGFDHRYALRKILLPLTKAGYSVRFPTQEGEEQPDGIAKVPIEIGSGDDDGVKNLESQLAEFREKLESTYPEIVRVSDGSDISIEAETTTNEKPKQTLKNLRKAVNNGNMCLLLAKDRSEDKGSIAYDASRIHNIMSEPEFVNEADEDGNRRFYNMGGTLELEEDYRAIRRADDANQTAWWETEDGGLRYVARGGDETELMTIDDKSKINNLTRDDVKYSYRYDTKTKEYIVYMNINGTRQRKTYEDKEVFKNKWSRVRPPFVPEVEFESMPTEDDWGVAIVPDDDKDLPILKYEVEDGEGYLTPLLEADANKIGERISIEDATNGTVRGNGETSNSADSVADEEPEPDTDDDGIDIDSMVDDEFGSGESVDDEDMSDGTEDNDSEESNVEFGDADVEFGSTDDETDSENGEDSEATEEDGEEDSEDNEEEIELEPEDDDEFETENTEPISTDENSDSNDQDQSDEDSINGDDNTKDNDNDGSNEDDTDQDVDLGLNIGHDELEAANTNQDNDNDDSEDDESNDQSDVDAESNETEQDNETDEDESDEDNDNIATKLSPEFGGGNDENKTSDDGPSPGVENNESDENSTDNDDGEEDNEADDESEDDVEIERDIDEIEVEDENDPDFGYGKDSAYDDIHIFVDPSPLSATAFCGDSLFDYEQIPEDEVVDDELCNTCAKIKEKRFGE